MRNPISGTQFRLDVKLAQKRGKDLTKLREVILLLIEGGSLPTRFKDLLLYKIDGDDLYLVRTGTHSDLF